MSYFVFASLAVFSFVVQLLSVFIVFRKVDSTDNKRYRFFQLQFLTVWTVFFGLFFGKNTEASFNMWISSGVLSICLGLFFYCSALIRKNKLSIVFSEDSPEFHISKGPYAVIRHPFYSSYIFTYVALAISLHDWMFSAIASTMLFTYYFAARFEEKKFERSRLAASYSKYRASTGMFFPKLWPKSTKPDSSNGVAA